jgi:AcrR family transcriptional regulator
MTSTTATAEPVKPLRRDAAANRVRLIEAAAEVFDEQGIDASVEEIARVAGVGMGTLYRRFPTKAALIEALVGDMQCAMLELAEQAHAQPDGCGLEYYLEASTAYQANHRGCLPMLWTAAADPALVQRLRRMIAGLLEDAKAHGRARADLRPTDVTVVFWSLRGVIDTTRGSSPDAWRRHLEIVVAGLRPAGSALVNPPLTQRQVDRILAGA